MSCIALLQLLQLAIVEVVREHRQPTFELPLGEPTRKVLPKRSVFWEVLVERNSSCGGGIVWQRPRVLRHTPSGELQKATRSFPILRCDSVLKQYVQFDPQRHRTLRGLDHLAVF